MRLAIALGALCVAGSAHAAFAPTQPAPWTAKALAWMRESTTPLTPSDQQCIGPMFSAIDPYLATMTYFGFYPYNQSTALWNGANVAGWPRMTFGGTVNYQQTLGWNGDGSTGIGYTGVTPNADTNAPDQNHVGMGTFLITDGATLTALIGAAGAGTATWFNDIGGTGATSRLNAGSNYNISVKIPVGYYGADRNSTSVNIGPNEVVGTKDAVQCFSGQQPVAPATWCLSSSNPAGLPTAALTLFYSSAGIGYGNGTLAEADYGAPRDPGDRLVISAAVSGALSCLGYLPPDPEPALPAYFSPTQALGLGGQIVIRSAQPPPNNTYDNTNYAYAPLTGAFGGAVNVTNATTWTSNNAGQEVWMDVWANRMQTQAVLGIAKAPNPLYPVILDSTNRKVGMEFSPTLAAGVYSPVKANAATKALILYENGASQAVWVAPLVAAGICATYPCVKDTGVYATSEIVSWSVANGAPATYFPASSQDGKGQHVSVDHFIIPPATWISTQGYAQGVDYEPQDGRPTTGATSAHDFLIDLATTVHGLSGRKFYIYTNPWDGGQSISGFTSATMPDIMAATDYITMTIYGLNNSGSQQAEYCASIIYLSGTNPSQTCDVSNAANPSTGPLNKSKIVMLFFINTNTNAVACWMHTRTLTDSLAGYHIWPDGAPQGGASPYTGTNLMLFNLLYGHGATPGVCP